MNHLGPLYLQQELLFQHLKEFQKLCQEKSWNAALQSLYKCCDLERTEMQTRFLMISAFNVAKNDKLLGVEERLTWLRKALDLAQGAQDENMKESCYTAMAQIHLGQGDCEPAIVCLNVLSTKAQVGLTKLQILVREKHPFPVLLGECRKILERPEVTIDHVKQMLSLLTDKEFDSVVINLFETCFGSFRGTEKQLQLYFITISWLLQYSADSTSFITAVVVDFTDFALGLDGFRKRCQKCLKVSFAHLERLYNAQNYEEIILCGVPMARLCDKLKENDEKLLCIRFLLVAYLETRNVQGVQTLISDFKLDDADPELQPFWLKLAALQDDNGKIQTILDQICSGDLIQPSFLKAVLQVIVDKGNALPRRCQSLVFHWLVRERKGLNMILVLDTKDVFWMAMRILLGRETRIDDIDEALIVDIIDMLENLQGDSEDDLKMISSVAWNLALQTKRPWTRHRALEVTSNATKLTGSYQLLFDAILVDLCTIIHLKEVGDDNLDHAALAQNVDHSIATATSLYYNVLTQESHPNLKKQFQLLLTYRLRLALLFDSSNDVIVQIVQQITSDSATDTKLLMGTVQMLKTSHRNVPSLQNGLLQSILIRECSNIRQDPKKVTKMFHICLKPMLEDSEDITAISLAVDTFGTFLKNWHIDRIPQDQIFLALTNIWNKGVELKVGQANSKGQMLIRSALTLAPFARKYEWYFKEKIDFV